MPKIPVSSEFLRLIFDMQNDCEVSTKERLPDLGKSAPKCFEELGTSLSYLDRMSSCFWECRGGDHVIERILGRAASSALASLRLLLFGHYDESLSLIRSLGETSNLLLVFNRDNTIYQEWLNASEDVRKRSFSAVKVRLKLEEMGIKKDDESAFVLMGEQRYSVMSGRSVHLNPATAPQSYNFSGLPMWGGHYQEIGFLTCLNELCRAVGLIVVFAPKILGYPVDRKKEIQDVASTLLAAVGRIDVLTDWEALRRLLEKPD